MLDPIGVYPIVSDLFIVVITNFVGNGFRWAGGALGPVLYRKLVLLLFVYVEWNVELVCSVKI